MHDGLTPHFTPKYVGPYENLHNLHPNMYTLKLLINFVAQLTFHISKLTLFLRDEHRPNWKQKVQLEDWWPKSKTYSTQSKHALETRGIW
jgi:hypothetical protein